MRSALSIFVLLLVAGCQSVPNSKDASLVMPALFSDGMVLQRGKPVAIWGKAAPGTRIRVSMANRHAEAMANEAGAWRAYLESLDAGGPHELTVRAGATRKIVRDVLVGEVWLCSGQSNMAMTMQPGPQAVLNVEQELAEANYPSIRLFNVPRATKFEPQDDCPGAKWEACTPETVRPFSAVGYFFGRRIEQELDVPIGLINSSRGASPAEAWTGSNGLMGISEWQPVMNLLPKLIADSARQKANSDRNYNKWYMDLDSFDLGHDDGKAIWADPNLDAKSWKTIKTPGIWEEQGFPTLDGFAWYRKEIDIPAAWAGKALRLKLTALNDADRTWFNGEIVGQMEGSGTPREYAVPAYLVRAGRNVIAVRVYDMGNVGGFIGAPQDMHLDLVDGAPTDSIPLAGEWAFQAGMDIGRAPEKPVPPVYVEGNQRIPTVLYNAMIAPLVPYGLRGVIWYQGEGNVGRARQYRTLFPAMINDWRTAFRQGDLPFYFVQLAPFHARTDDANAPSPIAELRDAQARVARGPNTGMALTIDIGDADNVHPRNKQDVGKRLALIALKQAYGKDVVASGPQFAEFAVNGSEVRIRLDRCDGGLRTSDGAAPRGFAIAGADNVFHWADARIENDVVVLRCMEVAEPHRVRYAWADNPGCNLYNGAGLPCAPFGIDLK